MSSLTVSSSWERARPAQPSEPSATIEESWNIAPDYIAKREQLRKIAHQFGVDPRTAALQFAAAPDVVASLIVEAHTASQALADATAMKASVTPDFWEEFRRQKLIAENAPLPPLSI